MRHAALLALLLAASAQAAPHGGPAGRPLPPLLAPPLAVPAPLPFSEARRVLAAAGEVAARLQPAAPELRPSPRGARLTLPLRDGQ